MDALQCPDALWIHVERCAVAPSPFIVDVCLGNRVAVRVACASDGPGGPVLKLDAADVSTSPHGVGDTGGEHGARGGLSDVLAESTVGVYDPDYISFEHGAEKGC